MTIKRPAVRRFIEKIFVVHPTGCWLWQAKLHYKGYAKFRNDAGKKVFAHRWAYEWFRDPIPEGLQIDHLCRTRECVNPWHMEPVTHMENHLRGNINQNKHKTHCDHGHPLTGDNLHIVKKTGERRCLECNRRQCREYYWRKKAEGANDMT